MNLRLLVLSATLALSAVTLTAQAATQTTSPKSQQYQYGMHLKIGRVLSMTEEPTAECKVVNADMKYIDTSGKPEDLSYRKLSDACEMQN